MPKSSTQWPGGAPARKSSAKKILQEKDGQSASDGDTLHVKQALRLVSCDTPESHYPTANSVDAATKKLKTCRERLEKGDYDAYLPRELRAYLLKRLTATAGKQQIDAANRAHDAFEKMLKNRLNKGGIKRQLGVLPTGEVIDSYGRMLAYLTPWFDSKKETVPKDRAHPDRRTFNLQMVEEGWAAFFPIYGSLPTHRQDFDLGVKAARVAWKKKAGVWKLFGKNFLLGYEFRMCVKLGQPYKAKTGTSKAVTAKTLAEGAFARHCVDISTSKWKDVGLHGFWNVEPPNRLWFWSTDQKEALKALGVK
ncbi:MAG: thermonuclease family protein [Verrucomicrobiaceae bacterium]